MTKEKLMKICFPFVKNKKWIWVIVGAYILLFGSRIIMQNIYGPLPEQFDAVAVEEDAKEVVEYFNSRDYQSIINMTKGFGDGSVTVEQMAEQCDIKLDELGAFKGYESVKLVGASDDSTETEFGGAIIKAEYENGNAKFTIAFNEEMQLAQFYVQ